MGYYFPNALTVEDLGIGQRALYDGLRAEGTILPPQITEHLQDALSRIETPGQIMSGARAELFEDALVRLARADGDPKKMELLGVEDLQSTYDLNPGRELSGPRVLQRLQEAATKGRGNGE